MISKLNKTSLTYLSKVFRVLLSLRPPDPTLLLLLKEGTEDRTVDITDKLIAPH